MGDPDHELEEFGFGRAHHRVLHFVYRYPGLKVADLLDILRITKQSLGRVLKQLLDQGYMVQKEGANDRRQRLLYVTRKGEALAMKLAGLQTARITRALRDISPEGARGDQPVPRAMIDRRRPRQGAGFDLRDRQQEAKGVIVAQGGPSLQPPRHRRGWPTTPRICWWSTTTAVSAICSRAFCPARVTASPPRSSAADARAKLLGLHFDLLILDVMMPGETGFDLARFTRARPRCRSSC